MSQQLTELLEAYKNDSLSLAEATRQLESLPFENLGYARVDHARAVRQGFPEVVFGMGKTPEQVAGIVHSLARRASNILVTRTDAAMFDAVREVCPDAEWHAVARLIRVRRDLQEGMSAALARGVVGERTDHLAAQTAATELLADLHSCDAEPRIYDCAAGNGDGLSGRVTC